MAVAVVQIPPAGLLTWLAALPVSIVWLYKGYPRNNYSDTCNIIMFTVFAFIPCKYYILFYIVYPPTLPIQIKMYIYVRTCSQ